MAHVGIPEPHYATVYRENLVLKVAFTHAETLREELIPTVGTRTLAVMSAGSSSNIASQAPPALRRCNWSTGDA